MTFKNYPNLIFASSDISFGNMSLKKGDPKEALKNRKKFLASLSISTHKVVTAAPNHGNKVEIIHEDNHDFDKDLPETESLITNKKNLFLMMKTGDCIPIGLYDPQNNVVGLIHASRISLENQIITEVISILKTNFNTNPQNLLIQFGPSIGPCCYELEYIDQKMQKFLSPFLKKEGDIFKLDLWNLAAQKLTKEGVKEENIQNPKICTYHSGKYFSHKKTIKKSLPSDYRFATIIGIK